MNHPDGIQILEVNITYAGYIPGVEIVLPFFGIFVELYRWRLDFFLHDGCLVLSVGPFGLAVDTGCRLFAARRPREL